MNLLRNLPRPAALILLLAPTLALAQGAVLQGGPTAPGRVPMYVGQGSQQAVVQDSGPAGGGAKGLGLAELLLTKRGSGTPPYAGGGSGPFGTTHCHYDAPTTNATGYHYLCFDPNAQGGGLIAYGAAGGAAQLPLNFNINGAVVPFPSGSPAGPTVTRHSASEIAYTLQQSDCGNISVGTNNLNAMVWALPQNTGTFSLCANLTVTNAGIQPLFINAQNGLFNVYDSATPTRSGYSQLAVSQNQTVVISADGAGNWLFSTSQAAYSNGYEKSFHLTSYSLSNGGPFFGLSGTPTAGDIIGFDFSYDTTAPARNTLSFRYTFLTSSVAELETAAKALVTLMQTNATLVAVVAPDNAPYFTAVQTAPLPTPQWLVAMNMVYPFNPNKNPKAVVFNSPGHTATIAMLNDLGGGVVSSALDIGSWIGLGRGTLYAGRQPAAGDRIAGIFITGETTGNPINNHDFQPIYISLQGTILDPTPGVAKADLTITAGSIGLLVGNQAAWGLGGVTVIGGVLNVSANFSGFGGALVPAGTVGNFTGPDGSGAFVNTRGFGGAAAFVMQTANGTGGVPLAVNTGNTIGALSFGGFNGAAAYTQSAAVNAVASETYTAAHSGSQLEFFTTATATNTLTEQMRLQPSGTLAVGNTFDAASRGLVTAVSNTAAAFSPFAGARFYGASADGVISVSMLESFGGAGTAFTGRSSGGTGTTPSATAANTTLVTLSGTGFTSALSTIPNGAVAVVADSLWTASNAATHIGFFVTPTGSKAIGEQARLNQSGAFAIGVTTDSGIGTLQLKKQTFASLTACSATLEGAMASVTDSSTATWGATITGGSTNHVLAYCNNTNWTVSGK